MVLDGKLTLEDDVRRFVPELPEYPRTVTLRHLLHHRGGLPDYIGPLVAAGADDVTTEAEALAVLARLAEVEFSPGERCLAPQRAHGELETAREVDDAGEDA